MDRIPISEADVIPLESLATDVAGLRILIVNVYAIWHSPTDWILIDCGLPHSGGRIRGWVEEHFGEGTRPRAIILTHGHFDHAGSVEELVSDWNVPVFVHPLELPYVTGVSDYPPPDPTVGGGLMSMLSKLYPRGPSNVGSRVETLPEGGTIPGFPEWRWLHTPGHTEGHISLFRESDRLLLAGDAFCTTKQESFMAVASQRPELHGPPAYFTTDWDQARESVRRLAGLRPRTVGPGHGQPLAGPDVSESLEELARDFDVVARPEHGRYVEEPVRAAPFRG